MRQSLLGSGSRVRLVLSTAPPAAARRIARTLVEGGTAACVNVLPGAWSTYRWKGKREEARESLLLVKTTARALSACVAALVAAHPYEVPEVLVGSPRQGLPAYLAWVEDSSRGAGG